MVGNDHDHAVDDGEMVVHNDPDGADEVVEEEDKNIHCSPDDDLVDKMPANAAVVDDDYDTLTVEGDLHHHHCLVSLDTVEDDEVVDEDDPSGCPYPWRNFVDHGIYYWIHLGHPWCSFAWSPLPF